MRKRAVILNTAIVFGFVIVAFRLACIMLLDHERYVRKAEAQQKKKDEVRVRRGVIFDRRGRELAVNFEMDSVYCDPKEMSATEVSARALSEITGKPAKSLLKKCSSEGRFVWIERKVEPDVSRKIRELDIKGLCLIPDSKRFYPNNSLASHVLGFVDIDNNGLEGIERQYDIALRGIGRKILIERDAGGRTLSKGVEMESKGNDLVLTLDEGLQHMVEEELDNAVVKWRANAATAIMMDPFTGAVLALANRPSFNLNGVAESKSPQRRNRAITDGYEPGSTFKIIIGTAALEEKTVSLNKLFDCSSGYAQVGRRKIRDAHRHGVLTFEEVIQKSSNVGSIMIGMGLGKERVYSYARRYGFGEKTGIDLPGEISGWIRPPERWSGISIGAISIGQEVAVTPLQVLRAYSVIANGGFLVKPHLASRILSPEGATVWSFEPERRRVISAKTADTFREILKKVTEEGGTAKGAAVEGNEVAGKTGTAQVIDPRTKRYSREKFVSSFVGFVPADDPGMALIVIIYEPKGQIYGGVVAAPVFKRIATNALSYLDVPRDDVQKNILVVSK
jgi:cell division protein FtsI (penicillin-binding protein 3)